MLTNLCYQAFIKAVIILIGKREKLFNFNFLSLKEEF